jgi:hypothetical protein
MAAFAAVATQEGRDARTPFPLLRMVGEYLTIDQLMPPCRLRWSRRLGRPMMGDLWRTDIVGKCFIEELHAYETNIEGVVERDHYPHPVRELSTLYRGHTRHDIWFVAIIDTNFEDAPYMQAWRLRYGYLWPDVALYRVHPVLSRLYDSYLNFLADVCRHGRERDRERWVHFLPPAGHDDD